MKLEKEKRQVIAGEYVLGLLPKKVQDAFEAKMLDDPRAANDTGRWERELAPLNALAPEQIPQRSLRSRILAGITERSAASEEAGSGLLQSLFFWRGTAALMASGLVALALLPGLPGRFTASGETAPQVAETAPADGFQRVNDRTRGGSALSAEYLSLLSAEENTGVWIVRFDEKERRLKVRVLDAPDAASNKDFELWLLPGGDAAPVSLGVLPIDAERGVAPLPLTFDAPISADHILAVSLEPEGGSPTGLPTGPVLTTGKVFEI